MIGHETSLRPLQKKTETFYGSNAWNTFFLVGDFKPIQKYWSKYHNLPQIGIEIF